MDKADTAIIFIDEHTFQQKNIEPYSGEILKTAFNKADVIVFNQVNQLKAYLENVNLNKQNLLLMSSGNFGGLNLSALTQLILQKSAVK